MKGGEVRDDMPMKPIFAFVNGVSVSFSLKCFPRRPAMKKSIILMAVLSLFTINTYSLELMMPTKPPEPVLYFTLSEILSLSTEILEVNDRGEVPVVIYRSRHGALSVRNVSEETAKQIRDLLKGSKD